MNPRALASLEGDARRDVVDRDSDLETIREDVRSILDRVRDEGDDALREFSATFDDVELDTFDVSDAAAAAVEEIDDDVRAAIEDAMANVAAFHERQLPADWTDEFDGRELGRRFRPIERVGAYVPGGSAAYPSTAIMTVVPARIAGVEEVVVVTPPAAEMNPVTLAAIHLAGADEIYSVGGAHAIGALAYGTDSIDPVEKIVGPGNRWVAGAKAEVRGTVAIDFVAGPTEVCVVADDTADPELVAAELVAQAEHDPHSAAIAVTASSESAAAVSDAVEEQVPDRERADVIRSALENTSSGVYYADDLASAAAFADEYAAEHLVLMTADDDGVLDRIDSAGSVFLGEHSPVAVGDYASGTNHVLPTSREARTTGGLSVDTFLRSTTVQRLDSTTLDALADTVVTLAEAEGLEGHAESVRRRVDR